MDPTLVNPILNVSINATLLQPPQSWWASNTLIAPIASIGGVILGHLLTKGSERERDFLKARRRAYYEYMKSFFDAGRIKEWPPLLITEKLPILWRAALEAGEYEDISDISFTATLNEVLKSKNGYGAFQLKCHSGSPGGTKCKLIDGKIPTIEIMSFYGFIELIETLMQIDPSEIEMKFLIEGGNKYVPIFRNILLSERNRTSWQALRLRIKETTK